MARWIWLLLPLVGCDALGLGPEEEVEPPPPPITARFAADAVLQDCYWGGEHWVGVQSLNLTLEHRLDGAVSRELPAPGTCTSDVELYAEQSLDGGDPVPGLASRPAWEVQEERGRLPVLVPGLWHGGVFSSPERCGTLDESVGAGVELTDAGTLSGLMTPAVEPFLEPTIDGVRFEAHEGVDTGDVAELAWQAEGWDAAFVQIWREHEGEVREIITCGVSGTAFTIDDTAWDVANDSLIAESNRVVLGVVREDIETLDSGEARVLLTTRALHVLEPR